MAKVRDGREGTGGAATLEGAPPAPDSPPARQPKVGEWVHYHRLRNPRTNETNPVPAQVIYLSPKGELRVHVNIHDLGELIANLDTPYSPAPRVGHWSFPE